jgi:hypothetical protein
MDVQPVGAGAAGLFAHALDDGFLEVVC